MDFSESDTDTALESIDFFVSEDDYLVDSNSNESDDQKNYTVLKEEDIEQRQEADIAEVSNVLSVSKEAASLLLRSYSWDVNRVNEAWFSDEDKVRKAIGLLHEPIPIIDHVGKEQNMPKEVSCGICFDTFTVGNVESVGCGHAFCVECWTGYISTSINDGPACLTLKCPDPKCGAAVGPDMICGIASEEDKERYRKYLVRSYIEDRKNIKWCPAPGCDSAVEYEANDGENLEVTCLCSNYFCWNCSQEAHRPINCETIEKWNKKNKSDAENMTWILAYTKPCPKCQRSIEKNEGCNHMTCRKPCGHQFCWICMGPWKDHKSLSCNSFGREAAKGTNEDEMNRKMAKQNLQRYAHFYERWAANDSSMKKAIADLHEIQTYKYAKLWDKQSHLQECELRFVVDAWKQIVDCRRVLKWSYAYGYYLPEDDSAKIAFFEYLQGQAEINLERLHHCAEQELKPFLDGDPPLEFLVFRQKLISLTEVTKSYFGNLVGALEKGLTDVKGACKKRKNTGNKKEKKKDKIPVKKSRVPATQESSSPWVCEKCTFSNVSSTNVCVICHNPFPGSQACDRCAYYNPRSADVCQICGLNLLKTSGN